MAVQEDEKEHESKSANDIGEPEGTSTDDQDTERKDDYEGFALLQDDVLCSIQDKPKISKSWLLLDSQSTMDVFCNPKLLSNIHDAKHALTLYCNAGKAYKQEGDLKDYGTVWYHLEGIANILSQHNVQKKHMVTYDSFQGTGFFIYKEDGTCCVFMPSTRGLFFSDVKGDIAHVLSITVYKN